MSLAMMTLNKSVLSIVCRLVATRFSTVFHTYPSRFSDYGSTLSRVSISDAPCEKKAWINKPSLFSLCLPSLFSFFYALAFGKLKEQMQPTLRLLAALQEKDASVERAHLRQSQCRGAFFFMFEEHSHWSCLLKEKRCKGVPRASSLRFLSVTLHNLLRSLENQGRS